MVRETYRMILADTPKYAGAHFAALKEGERVYVTTSEVESHMHELLIDPVDPDSRVPGSPDFPVPRATC